MVRRRQFAKKKKDRGLHIPQYNTVANFINVFEESSVEIMQGHIGETAREFSSLVRDVIRSQKYRWRPLSSRYLQYKKRSGLDLRTLIATGAYVRSIRATPRRKGGKLIGYTVGPPKGVHPPSGLPYVKLARIHEFGATIRGGKIPARPVWRPAWSAFIRRGRRQKILRTLARKLKRAARRLLRRRM